MSSAEERRDVALRIAGGEAVFQRVARRLPPATLAAARRGPVSALDDLRCLTVKDPWITLLGNGLKPYELRKVRTHYRGRVVLCSSANPSRTPDAKAARERLKPEVELLGHALFLARLADCWAARPEDAKGACCRPSEGEWVWHFVDVERLPEPQPISGLLGLYRVPQTLTRYLRRTKLL